MKAKLVNESLIPKEEFLLWWNEIYTENPDEDWEWILSSLMNDEYSSDEELIDYLIDETEPGHESVDPVLAQELVDHREGFLNYGLDIHES